MKQLFSNCVKLKSINIAKWNTKKVETMKQMFSGCTDLEYITVDNAGFNIEKLFL